MTFRILIFCGAMIANCWICQAGGFQVNLNGHRLVGMGYTGTGMALDGSSIYINPGSLIFAPKRSIQIGASWLFPNVGFLAEAPSVYQENMESKVFTPIYLYGSWYKNRDSKVAFGISINNPFGIGNKWPEQWKGRFVSQEFSFNSFFIQPGVSVKITDKFGVGLGIVYALGSMVQRKGIPFSGQDNTEGTADLSGGGVGWGLNAGFYFEPGENVSLGLTYRTSVTININDGTAVFDVPNSLSKLYPNTNWQSAITLPSILSFGMGANLREDLLLALDVNWTGWQVFDTLSINYNDNTQSLPDIDQARNFTNSMAFRLGIEQQATEWIQIRGGLYYDLSPVPEQYVSPDLPDANRIGISTGLGIKIWDKLSLETSILYEFSGERTAGYNDAAFAGTYKSNVWALGLGLHYQY